MTPNEPAQPPTGIDEPPGPEGAETRPDPPHRPLSNPATNPDPSEYPDPYDRREDPKDPDHPDPAAAQEGSTSDPPPPRNRDELLDRKHP